MQGKSKIPHENADRKVVQNPAQPCTPPESREFDRAAVVESWRKFIRAYPKHRYQNGGLAAFDIALTKVSESDLIFAARRFSAEVRAARPDGAAWMYCPGPARWLRAEGWRQYLNTEEQEQHE